MRKSLIGTCILVIVLAAGPVQGQRRRRPRRPVRPQVPQRQPVPPARPAAPRPQRPAPAPAATQSNAKVTMMSLSAPKAATPGKSVTLLPGEEELVDADAFGLYAEAMDALKEKGVDKRELHNMRSLPPGKFPVAKVQALMADVEPVLKLIERAAKCRKCTMPMPDPTSPSLELSGFRDLASLVALKARLEIIQGRHDRALRSLQSGFAIARHVGAGRTIIEGLVGVAIGALMCGQTELLVQQPGVTSLHTALGELPRPFVDMKRLIDLETEQVQSDPSISAAEREAFKAQAKQTSARVLEVGQRLDRHLAALRCVEALRLHAAAHEGTFPETLDQLGPVAAPKDPATEKPYVYRRMAETAAWLESPAMEGVPDRKPIRYHMTWRR